MYTIRHTFVVVNFKLYNSNLYPDVFLNYNDTFVDNFFLDCSLVNLLSCWIFLVGREILSASLRWWCQKGHSRHKSTVSRVGVRPDYSRSFPKGQVLLQCVPNSIQRATTLDTFWCKRMQIVIIIAFVEIDNFHSFWPDILIQFRC